jgi:hypothetical protein
MIYTRTESVSAAYQAAEKDSYADCPEHRRRVRSTDFGSTYEESTPPLMIFARLVSEIFWSNLQPGFINQDAQ